MGAKSELFDRRVRLNEALFYVRYTDLIRQVVSPITNANGQKGEETLFKNAAKMTTYGIENELTVRITDGLVLRVPFSFQHCEYGNFTTLDAATGATIDLSGLPVNRCPTVTATLDLNYTMPVPWTNGHIVVDVNDNYVVARISTRIRLRCRIPRSRRPMRMRVPCWALP